ncbi:hypothetical protein [Ochrobactrum sp. A-1]|uniref:hypothetical protein n=1 Tax=Ochrobactrum sp. A-1 TaxID=2920940 RepID=UPI001F0A1600|nr:hypothetical protein [Ochrobactrum sp. A-1]
MSAAILISLADRRPEDLALNTAFHQSILDDLNREATFRGWSGSIIDDYASGDGIVAVTIAEGEQPATIEDLRKFREDRKLREEEFRMTGRLI